MKIIETREGLKYTTYIVECPELETIIKDITNRYGFRFENLIFGGSFAASKVLSYAKELFDLEPVELKYSDIDIYAGNDSSLFAPFARTQTADLIDSRYGKLQFIIENPAARILLPALSDADTPGMKETSELYLAEIADKTCSTQSKTERILDLYDLTLVQSAIWIKDDQLHIMVSNELYKSLALKELYFTQRHKLLIEEILESNNEDTAKILFTHLGITTNRLRKYATKLENFTIGYTEKTLSKQVLEYIREYKYLAIGGIRDPSKDEYKIRSKWLPKSLFDFFGVETYLEKSIPNEIDYSKDFILT